MGLFGLTDLFPARRILKAFMPKELSKTRLARAALALAIFSALLGSTAPSPLYPHYLETMHLEKVMGTAIFSIYAAGTLLALFVGGKLGPKVEDLRLIILPGLVVTALGAIMFAFAHSLPTLLVGRFLNGFGTGAITGMASSALFAIYPTEMRRVAAVTATLAFTGGATGGPILSSLAISMDLAPTVTPFIVIVILSALAFAGLCVCYWPPKETPDEAMQEQTRDSRVKMPLFVLACLGVCVAWMLGSILMALGTDLGLSVYVLPSAALAGLVPAVFQLFAGIGQFVWGKYPVERAIGVGLGGMVLAQVALILAEPSGLGFVMLGLMPICGFFYGAAFVGALGLANKAATPATREVYISRFYVAGYLSNSLPTVLVGYLSDLYGLKAAFFLFSLALIGLGIAGLLMLRRYRHDPLIAVQV